ncbi:VOC family protein [Geodermatophilus sp. CPCC 206100]|uniref:VOC family protein n=1 Tax=Geodermatophilus sp. CPCC 206100 TaxID=3020054 RepID=UPI003AFFCEDA
MAFIDPPGATAGAGARDLQRIVQVTIPVSDLARSAAWYRDLLDLRYVREFSDHTGVTGCGLVDWQARYLLALRLRSTTAGGADLRGEHPVILEAADRAAAERVQTRATGLGIPSTAGTHVDGSWIEFLDPDGIALRIVHSAAGPRGFLGVCFSAEGGAELYDAPRLRLPAPRSAHPAGDRARPVTAPSPASC